MNPIQLQFVKERPQVFLLSYHNHGFYLNISVFLQKLEEAKNAKLNKQEKTFLVDGTFKIQTRNADGEDSVNLCFEILDSAPIQINILASCKDLESSIRSLTNVRETPNLQISSPPTKSVIPNVQTSTAPIEKAVWYTRS